MAEKDEPSLQLPSFRRRQKPPAPTLVEDVEQRPSRAASGSTLRLHLPGPLAASMTGLLVGVVAVGLVWASQGLCEAMWGTSSCGGGPGLLLLLVVVVALTLLGAALLGVLGVEHAGSTSTLAVCLATVVTLVLFIGMLGERRGALVVVLTSVVAYTAARAVTVAAVDSRA